MRAGTRGEDTDVVVEAFFVLYQGAAARFPSPYFRAVYTTPENPFSAQRHVIRSRCSGYRAPCTVIFEMALLISRRSSGLSSTASAPIFSSRRSSLREPGMGTIHGF